MPDTVAVVTEKGLTRLRPAGEGAWGGAGASVRAGKVADGIELVLEEARERTLRVELSWKCRLPDATRLMNDHWERGYGDLAWTSIRADRIYPWYFLACERGRTWCGGVKTQPAALVYWQVGKEAVSLVCDVRCGGRGLELRDRELKIATVTTFFSDNVSPHIVAREFCRKMCREPILPDGPVYGFNDWHYGLGANSRETVLRDAALLSKVSPASPVRPFFMIDAGWQVCGEDNGGPWDRGNGLFGDMGSLAEAIVSLGVRPGIWTRPLRTHERVPDGWVKGTDRSGRLLDPSVPEVLEYVRTILRRFVDEWGYELVKHDFSTWDLLGHWGFEMGEKITSERTIRFADGKRTTAEIIIEFYRAVLTGAGDGMIIGCNTLSHLAAGLTHLQRTGDDTSGYDWPRTRKMGVNTMAFRMAHHGAFYASDCDCVGLTKNIPWHLNRQWLDLMARSGAPVCVSPAPDAVGREQREAIKSAFALAVEDHPAPVALDWMENPWPRRWRLDGVDREFDWGE